MTTRTMSRPRRRKSTMESMGTTTKRERRSSKITKIIK